MTEYGGWPLTQLQSSPQLQADEPLHPHPPSILTVKQADLMVVAGWHRENACVKCWRETLWEAAVDGFCSGSRTKEESALVFAAGSRSL